MPAPDDCCPDCWCRRGDENHSAWNVSVYCDTDLRERILRGERVEVGLNYDEETDTTESLFYTGCTRCKGSGQVILTAWQENTTCFGCLGLGALLADHKGVQRTARWAATFQSNREPGKMARPGPAEHTHPRRR